jgi:hypothetical protein
MSDGDGRAHEVAFVRRLGAKLGATTPLSKALYEDRPFLRPVVFVKAQINPFLFQEEEDILQPGVEEVGSFTIEWLASRMLTDAQPTPRLRTSLQPTVSQNYLKEPACLRKLTEKMAPSPRTRKSSRKSTSQTSVASRPRSTRPQLQESFRDPAGLRLWRCSRDLLGFALKSRRLRPLLPRPIWRLSLMKSKSRLSPCFSSTLIQLRCSTLMITRHPCR